MQAAYTIHRRIVEGLTSLVVCGLSLILLLYVGNGTAKQNYEEIYIEKLLSQGEIMKSAIEARLRSGLPLRQFVGFASAAEPIMTSDNSIAGIAALDSGGQRVFAAGDKKIDILPQASVFRDYRGAGELRSSDQFFQLVLPLDNKFENVGKLLITVTRAAIESRVESDIAWLAKIGALAAFAFGAFVFLFGPKLAHTRTPWIAICYGAIFLAISGLLVSTLITLYADGVRGKADALANSLAKRLDDVVLANINFDDVHGLDKVFVEYKRLNPDIRAAALTVDAKIVSHTDPNRQGTRWIIRDDYEYAVRINPENASSEVKVIVALPKEVVYRRVVRSVKNFAALFVASGFFALLFMDLAKSVQMVSARNVARKENEVEGESALNLVKPVYFLAVFVENLSYAFLPQYVKGVVDSAGMSANFASTPFIAFYLCFALALLPAARVERKFGARALISTGLLLSCVGLLTMFASADYYHILAARIISGIGQGVLFIGVQSYILAVTTHENRTRGAGIIVFGFQAGMISGMAIGSLLVRNLLPSGVFAMGAAIAFAALVFLLAFVPRIHLVETAQRNIVSLRETWSDLKIVLTDGRFLKTMLFVGVPAKAVMTGVILFALPLLLAKQNYLQEDIGQITMIYAICVIVASNYLSKLSDLRGNTESILFWGTILSGIGLVIIAAFTWDQLAKPLEFGSWMTIVVIAGVAIVGIAHGFINAPIITHVSDSDPAARIGAGTVAAMYRFLERIGHSVGPLIVGQLLIHWNFKADVLGWIGLAIILFGFMFLIKKSPAKASHIEMKGAA